MFNVLESCSQGRYPLPSEKAKTPAITKEEALRIMKIALLIDHSIRKESLDLKKKAMLATDAQSQA